MYYRFTQKLIQVDFIMCQDSPGIKKAYCIKTTLNYVRVLAESIFYAQSTLI